MRSSEEKQDGLMTEAEWLTCTDPTPMLEHFRKGNAALMSVRKRRLFACACCRRIHQLLDEEGLAWLRAAERLADHPGRHSELISIREASEVAAGALRAAALTACRKVDFATVRYAADQAVFAVSETHRDSVWVGEKQEQAALMRDLVGNPFRPMPTLSPSWLRWNDGTVVKIAQAIYDERRFEDLPILADALEDAGCGSEDILAHCRGPGPHTRGCWVLDLVLDKS